MLLNNFTGSTKKFGVKVIFYLRCTMVKAYDTYTDSVREIRRYRVSQVTIMLEIVYISAAKKTYHGIILQKD